MLVVAVPMGPFQNKATTAFQQTSIQSKSLLSVTDAQRINAAFEIMKVSTFALCVYIVTVSAGALRDQALSHASSLAFSPSPSQERATHGERDTQVPLIANGNNDYNAKDRHWAKLEIESGSWFGIPFYYTNIALGTPNQAFRMLLDLDFGGAIVRAPECNAPYFDCGHGFAYYNNKSSTYQDEHERFGLHLPGQFANGNVSTDCLQLVSLNISNVTFGEVDDFHGENIFLIALEDVVDG